MKKTFLIFTNSQKSMEHGFHIAKGNKKLQVLKDYIHESLGYELEDDDDRDVLDDLMEVQPIGIVELIPKYEGNLEISWYTSISDLGEDN